MALTRLNRLGRLMNQRWTRPVAWCLLMTAAMVGTAGCGPIHEPSSQRTAKAMTPDEAHAELKRVMIGAATAALPPGVGTVRVEDEQTRVPCGGAFGNDHSKLDSRMKVTNGDPNPRRTAVQMREGAGAYLQEQGWKILPNEDTAEGARLGFATKDGMSIQYGAVDGRKGATILGNSPCLPNPDPLTNKG